MKNTPASQEPLSTILRKSPNEDKTEIINTVRWVAWTLFSLFLVLAPTYFLAGHFKSALVVSIAIVPILFSIALLKQDSVSISSTFLSTTIVIIITLLATFGQGLYDISLLALPVILIVAGLFLRGWIISYLTILAILSATWLGVGGYLRWYEPQPINQFSLHDLPIAIIILIITGNAVYRLSKGIYQNLARAKWEAEVRKQTEQEREEVIEQLRRKNQELDRFAIRVSHDLKTPLITLAGFLGYLERDINEGNFERAKKDFSQINQAAKTMGKFVDELLDLSRVGRITNPPTDAPFSEIIQDSLKAADGILKAKQVQVEVDASFPIVHVDRVRIVQVMQNLITNAVKFTGDQSKPTIKIGCEKVKGQHIFSISDNGIGIALRDRERIFELFNKLDPDTEGTGIGLAMVKRIIEVHGGRIWVESEPGKGSTFLFTLENTKQQEIS